VLAFTRLLPPSAERLPLYQRLRHERIAQGDPAEGVDMKCNSSVRRGLALATIAGALAAPTASAAPVEQMLPHTVRDADRTDQPAPVRVVHVSADKGFDWGDAGIGATGVLALVAIASGAVIATRRRPAPGHTA
jgi:hypothetical protein